VTQLSLGYAPEHQGREVWRLEIDWARRAVEAIGHKDVAFALDIAPSTLTDALHEREPLGYAPERIKTMDAAEELRVTRELMQRLAPVLLREIDKEIGR
jgi:hypothetical protein